MLSSNQSLAVLMRSRFIRHNSPIIYHVKSSIWPGIKHHMHSVFSNICWIVGTGDKICLWRNKWLPESLASLLSIPEAVLPHLKAKVADLVLDKNWHFPDNFRSVCGAALQHIQKIVIPLSDSDDKLVWQGSAT